MTPFPITPEWLSEMAAAEDNGCVSVGGLPYRANALTAAPVSDEVVERKVLATLVELQRRRLRLSVHELAEKAEVDARDILAIEAGEDRRPEPRTVYNLSKALSLPEVGLMQLSGLVSRRDTVLDDASVRFAARSAPVDELTQDQRDALDEFVRALAK